MKPYSRLFFLRFCLIYNGFIVDGKELETSYQDLSPLSSGSFYRLTVHLKNGEQLISSVVFIENGQKTIRSFNVFPNPACDQIMLDVDVVDQQSINVYLTDVLGRSFTYQIDVQQGKNRIPLNISDLAGGVYRLHIRQDGTELSRSFIKR